MNPKFISTTIILLLTIAVIALGAGQFATTPSLLAQTDTETLTKYFLPAITNGAAQSGSQVALEQATDAQVVAAGPSPTGATIASDLADYPPGATVTLTGVGWQPGEAVDIFVNDDASQSWSLRSDPDPVADSAGAFTYSFPLPNWFVANYSVIATGSAGSGTATTSFTDLAIGTYDQCSNDDGDGYASGDTGCRWINGNLQSNNSTYFEGDATVQRVWLTEFAPGTSHSITLKYGTTKGGKHAYDFLTTWDWSENWITLDDRCQNIDGCTTAGETVLDISQDPNVPDTFEPSAVGERQFVMRGGTLNSATAPVIVSGDYNGDSETVITINFTVANSGPMCETKQGATTCSVALWFGAHVAAQVNWGLGQGAGSISGSPYHVALDALDGAAVGQRDNQMQSGVITSIPNGTIIIIKDAIPDDAQDFSFNLTNNSTINQDFLLDDDSDPTSLNSQTFSVPPGSWTASELNLPTGWSLTNLVCVDPTTNTTVNTSTGVASINLTSNETVTCTYTNSRNTGSLKLTKSLTGGPSGYTGPFTIHYDCGAFGSGDKIISAGSSETISSIPTGTTCTVSEPTLPTAPTGYTFGTPTFNPTNGTVTISSSGATVEVITNNTLTRNTGSLQITKAFDPLTSGFSGKFSISYDCDDGGAHDGTVQLGTGESTTISGIPTGTSCTVSEPTLPTAPTGWTFGTPSISPAQPVVINSTTTPVEVTVTNSIIRDQGYLKISKVFDPLTSGFSGNFTIVYNCGSGDQTVTLAAGASTTVGPFDTGTSCTVSEPTLPTAPSGWTFGTPSVSGSPATIVKGNQAAAVEVTVTNTISRDKGSLTITKSVTGAPNGFTGSIDVHVVCTDDGGTYDRTINIPTPGTVTITDIPTSHCTVTETGRSTPPTGYSWGASTITGSPADVTKNGTVTVNVTNEMTRDTGSLELAKRLSGGPAGYTGPFTIHWDCGAFGSGDAQVSVGSPATISNIPTGTSCTVSEPTLPTVTGYSFGTPGFSPDATVIIPDGNGSSVTVTTNNTLTRDVGSLKIAKSVTGDVPPNFSQTFTFDVVCTLAGSADLTYNNLAIDYPTANAVTQSNIPTGYSCTVTEDTPTNVTGYTWSTPMITGNPAVITTKDTEYTVTVENPITRDTGSFKITKQTSNPDGATLPAAFTGTYDCGAGYTGNFNVADGASQTITDIPTGNTCSVVETVPAPIAGYTWGAATYTPATIVISNKGGTFEIVIGNSITRNRGSLTIVKKVINDNGGTATVSAFDITTSAGALTFDSGTTSGATTTYTSQKRTVFTGSYTLQEKDVSGYTEGSWSCTGAAGTVVPTFNNGSVVVGKDEDVTCTITNDDIAPTLTVIKVLVPSADSGQFNLRIDGTTYATGGDGATTGAITVNAGAHTVDETGSNGTALSSYVTLISGDCAADGSITLALGENKSCTITNTRRGNLTIVKNAVPDDSQDFAFTTTGSGLSNFSLDDDSDPTLSNSQSFSNLLPGSYTVAEGTLTNWTLVDLTCVDPDGGSSKNLTTRTATIDLDPGETITCTFINEKDATLTVLKYRDSNGNGVRDSGEPVLSGWSFWLDTDKDKVKDSGETTLTTNGAGQVTFSAKPNAAYQICEVVQSGWVNTDPGGSGTPCKVTATVQPGATVSLTFGNRPLLNLGAKTIGFWQNKNGQNIIKSYCKGVNSSSTADDLVVFLRQFSPFQDLSSSATCMQIASYATNVIKSASAAGAAMNAMLKAQMLATALDVYFSDPALGGNRINASAPIGSLTIDLTNICKMSNGAGGTATCSGSYRDVRSAFNNATSLSVMQMLVTAASYANSGGSFWYDNVKATQELAKDAFDAINNNVIFAP